MHGSKAALGALAIARPDRFNDRIEPTNQDYLQRNLTGSLDRLGVEVAEPDAGPLAHRQLDARDEPYPRRGSGMTVYAARPEPAARRREGSSAKAPPAKRAIPAAPSLNPSIRPNADTGVPSVDVNKLGRREVGFSCPRTDIRLAEPIARTSAVTTLLHRHQVQANARTQHSQRLTTKSPFGLPSISATRRRLRHHPQPWRTRGVTRWTLCRPANRPRLAEALRSAPASMLDGRLAV